jgi:hypothetical protein
MKKLLLSAGDKELNTITLDFACYLARLSKCKLFGVFPETASQEKRLAGAVTEAIPLAEGAQDIHVASASLTETHRSHKVQRFLDACTVRNVIGVPHVATSLEDIIVSTRFCDAVIIDSDFTMNKKALEPFPSHSAKKLMHEAACPVIVAPFSFDGIEEIILTYDGSKSSLYAIRQFLYLFPELKDTKTTILQVWLEEDEEPRDQAALHEWLNIHFSNIKSVVLEAPSGVSLIEYLLSHPMALIVMGGFGRGRVSRLLQPSASGKVVKLVTSALFIAHQ